MDQGHKKKKERVVAGTPEARVRKEVKGGGCVCVCLGK